MEVLLGKDLERLHFFGEVILLQLVTSKSIHGSPSVALTIVILATEFANGQLRPATTDVSKKLGSGIFGSHRASPGSPIYLLEPSGYSLLSRHSPNFTSVDFQQRNQNGEKEWPQHQAQKTKHGEPAD